MSENIEVTSIIDRYLEHARILYFYKGGEETMFISSADWMPRNLDRRIELLVPVLDTACRKKLWRILDTHFQDNVMSWRLSSDGSYRRLKPNEPEQAIRAQRKLYERAVQESNSNQPSQTSTFEPHQSSTPTA
jgi:polyphosphate kinase